MVKEQDHPDISPLVHPPLMAVLFILLAYLLGYLIPQPFAMPSAWQYFGLALVLVGFLPAIGAFIEFRKARTTLDPHGSPTHLVTSGIYRLTRNPIYLGFLFMLIGFPLSTGVIWGFVLAPFYMITMSRLVIEREEAYLGTKFKNEYTNYMSRVRRWL